MPGTHASHQDSTRTLRFRGLPFSHIAHLKHKSELVFLFCFLLFKSDFKLPTTVEKVNDFNVSAGTNSPPVVAQCGEIRKRS